ncbi:MAG: ABC transporter substrate-binding protein [Clostridia bacterium]|nr:ABC transporter substrate-binding protein [Clostridia bacterium]
MKKMKMAALLMACLMLVAMLAGCGKKADENVVKIGLIGPQTGAVAAYGLSVKNAIELYIKEANANGGINGKTIELIAYDDKGDPTEAKQAYDKLVTADEVVAVLGPVTSDPTFGVAEASVADNMPCITGTATHPDVTTYGDNFYRACFEDPFQGGTVARFAQKELGVKTVAIIYNTSSAYSTGLKDAFSKAANEAGMTILATEGYAEGDVDFKSQLTNIAAVKADALFMPDYYNNVYMIAKQAREAGINATFLGVDGTDGVLKIEGADTSVFEGMYFANHYAADDTADMVVNFVSNYKEAYNDTPDALAALGYDAAIILIDALKKVDAAGTDLSDRQAVIDAIAATDLDCVTGHITFDENNNPIKDCTIIKIVNAQYTFVTKY